MPIDVKFHVQISIYLFLNGGVNKLLSTLDNVLFIRFNSHRHGNREVEGRSHVSEAGIFTI